MDAETQEIRQARQRASVKWLLSKAFNNRVPDNLKEPFYRDHENQERLKPQIVVELGNATLYCQTLSNLYSDPNYQSLNHWSILQTLSRKGVPVAETADMPLTETVLIQTNPLRINAHMAVIESLMVLYAKEVASGDRIQNAIRRISSSNYQTPQRQSVEQSLLTWISYACASLKKKIDREVESNLLDAQGGRLQAPDIPPVQDFQDLCDGICLALLISYYCPKVLPWTNVRINYLPAVEDSIHNILLVSNFSQKHLPYTVFHMTPEDVTYMRGSMKLNLVVLLTDLFNLFEIHPAKCVCYPDMEAPDVIAKRNMGANEHGILHRRGLTVQPVIPIPDLRGESELAASGSPTNRPPFQVSNCAPSQSPAHRIVQQPNEFSMSGAVDNEAFVVHKSRGITTLSTMHQQQQQEPLVPARLRQAKEKSNSDTKSDERGDYVAAGRPSNWEQNRRPSYAGRRSRRNSSSEDSQLTIENFGGSQDQLNAVGRFERERDRKISNTNVGEPAVAVRSSASDARGSFQLGYDTDSGSEKQDRDTEKYGMQRQASIDNVSTINSNAHHNRTSNTSSPILHAHKPHSIEKDYYHDNLSESNACSYDYETPPLRKLSQSSMPHKPAAWQNNHNDSYEEDLRSLENTSKLSNIRMRLEEKRRRIEEDKRKIELALLRHQEKLSHDENEAETLKWETQSNESKRTPDIDPADLEKYQQSVALMNLNLQDIQQDIQRLATQQSQIQAQQLQAQQLIQAQQIANMLNQQQPYGSQQHIADHYQQRSMQQSNFGSTPHLPQSFNPNMSSYNSRPSSRDPYQQMQSQQQVQYVNDHGQYIGNQQQASLMQQPPYMRPGSMYNENMASFSNHPYGSAQFGSNQMQQQFMKRPPDYDGYSQHGLPYREPNSVQSDHFYLHESPPQPPPQRRTWSNSPYEQQQSMVDVNAWQSQRPGPSNDESLNWGKQQSSNSQGFVLHQNGSGGGELQHLFQNSSSPQHVQRNSDVGVKRQQSLNSLRENRSNLLASKSSLPAASAQPIPDEIMAPQSICFIGDEEDVEEIERNIIESMQSTRISEYVHQQQEIYGRHSNGSDEYDNNDAISQKLNITSGNLTYRIPSPSRPSLHSKSFQDPREEKTTEKGFYISFDDEQPKRPKPPLRAKRSPKKERNGDGNDDHKSSNQRESLSQLHNAGLSGTSSGNGSNSNGKTKFATNTGTLNSKEHNFDNKSTYNKYSDPPIQLRQIVSSDGVNNHPSPDRRHLEDMTSQHSNNQPQSPTSIRQFSPSSARQLSNRIEENKNKALVIGTDVTNLDPESVDEMERRKEKIMLLSLQRRQQQEEAKARKEIESAQRREREREKEEERARKKEEQMARRAAILEQHRLKKAMEEAEREGKVLDRLDFAPKAQSQHPSAPRLRQQRVTRPRPKTIHVDDGSVDISEASSISSRGKKGSSTNLTGYSQLSSHSMRQDYYKGSQDSLTLKESPDEFPSTTSSTPIGRRGSYKTSREPTIERGRAISRISVAKGSTLNFRGRKSNSLMNLCDTDSGLGRSTPPRRAPSPGMIGTGRHMPSPSGPGSLPPGLISKRRGFGYDDGSSDMSSTPNLMLEYSGPKLYKQPAAKSNRGIILNAVEYCVFPGAVNREAKQKVLEKIARSEAKHFLVLFRDAGCQFRALYSYLPETDQVSKLYGTGPSQVDEVMFDKFFKYNSGGKCFSQVHTKHLTVTIDAFTIHNSLWQGKKVHLPSKKDMALVI